MRHSGEDDLILYYYGEGRGRARIEQHLEACPSCAATYREIAGTLAMMAAPAVPERGEQYGLEVWQRLRHQLPEQELSWWRIRGRLFGGQGLALMAAAATLAIAAFVAGRFWSAPPRPAATVTSTRVPETAEKPGFRERILITAVADHLDRS